MARFNTLQTWLDWQEQFHPRPIDLGLDRATQVFKRLYPSYNKPLTIIVGGTNGKGSCVAFLEAIYKAQGYKVGTYTSPHIVHYRERIKINGVPTDDQLICNSFERIDNARETTSVSYFEFGTLAALDIFSRAKVDIQLLEVGLGGRLDAVNIIDADLSIITSIAIDHVNWLGNTRDSIAVEKAGIFRANTPSVIGDGNPPARLFSTAKEKQTPLLCLNKAFEYQINSHGWHWKSSIQTYENLPAPNLMGEHQFNNASTILMAITQLQSFLPVQRQAIEYGLQDTQLRGRFQLINSSPQVLLEVGHNPQAVQKLSEYLKKQFSHRKIHAVFSIMRDKDINGVLDIMKSLIDRWFISPLDSPRALTDDAMQATFKQKKIDNVVLGFQSFKETFSAAKVAAAKEDIILVFGSFYLVSEYLAEFEDRQ
ncbi:MAG: bifunctional tetrahydrofolate synthase/dihydrofolate synthase [Methylococcales bacterium]|nr:bifunctional tetrahydrofolate synthase/dihydrofolate synthase [Methylococcales bacterium]MCK5924476.1 bifunctional tetrahydrofolate synthase/dihydrofolate synthase [Methylococcales bacterium]